MKLPNPLDRTKHDVLRVLPDTSIKKLVNEGLIQVIPQIDTNDYDRFQPATLDVKLEEVYESASLPYEKIISHGKFTLPAKSISTVQLTEVINLDTLCNMAAQFVYTLGECRSTLRRLGAYLQLPGLRMNIAGRNMIEIINYSKNDLHFQSGDKVAQFFFAVNPYADISSYPFKQSPLGMYIRTLDMGVQVKEDTLIKKLHTAGYFSVSGGLTVKDGYVLVHATDKVKIMKDFAQGLDVHTHKYRDEYFISKRTEKCALESYDHIMFETKEHFRLSEHIGIWFWDNLIDRSWQSYMNTQTLINNLPLTHIPDGWIDPGYNGGFSRQPKWLNDKKRIIKPGDVIGYGKIFFFPKGVEHVYGSKGVSHYQKI